MKLKDMEKAELELLSYSDLAALVLKENKKPMNTAEIFKKICSLLGYTDDQYAERIGDFYTSLTTDKRFTLLDSAEWDFRDNHSIKLDIDEEDEETEIDEEYESEEDEDEYEDESEEDEDDIEEPLDDEELDVDDDSDIDELSIVDEDELEE